MTLPAGWQEGRGASPSPLSSRMTAPLALGTTTTHVQQDNEKRYLMAAFTITVTVECETPEQAEQVAAERLNHDEDYGFDYELGWAKVEPA